MMYRSFYPTTFTCTLCIYVVEGDQFPYGKKEMIKLLHAMVSSNSRDAYTIIIHCKDTKMVEAVKSALEEEVTPATDPLYSMQQLLNMHITTKSEVIHMIDPPPIKNSLLPKSHDYYYVMFVGVPDVLLDRTYFSGPNTVTKIMAHDEMLNKTQLSDHAASILVGELCAVRDDAVIRKFYHCVPLP